MRVPPSVHERAGSLRDGSSRGLRFRLVGRRRLLFVLLLVLLGSMVGAGIVARPPLRAWYHRRAAREELQRYHNPQAIHHLRVCREIWPRDPEVLLLAARAARRAGIYGDTERLLRIYQEVRGRDEAHTFELILLAVECQADKYSEQCWKYIDEGRYDAPLLMEALTRGYLRQYRLGQARLCLNRWKEMQPDNPQVFSFEGLYFLDYLHVSSDAVDSYRRAVELDADHEEARLGLAVALLGNKAFAEAAQHFERLRQDLPDATRVLVGLAECRDGLGDSDDAKRLVDDVLARQPHTAPALSLRGQLALKNGQWAEAENDLRQALRLQPMDHRARYSLILCLQRGGKEEEAQHEQQQLQRMEDDLARFHEIVTKDIAQRPADPALHCTLGQILLRSGQREEGLRWLRSALTLDPHFAPAQQALAEATRSEPRP